MIDPSPRSTLPESDGYPPTSFAQILKRRRDIAARIEIDRLRACIHRCDETTIMIDPDPED